jgi:nitrogen fixation protein NifQ
MFCGLFCGVRNVKNAITKIMRTNLEAIGEYDWPLGLPPVDVSNFGVVQRRHLAVGGGAPDLVAALEASLRVARAAGTGDLPLFAVTLGLPTQAFRELLRPEAQWLVSEVPDALLAQWVPTHFNALAAMLWEFRAADHAAIRCLAQAIAAACHGERHLWQDMGFAARDELSALIAQCFPRLHALNAANLKWKRFLFALLGERLGIGGGGLIPPACPRCSSYRSCYPA